MADVARVGKGGAPPLSRVLSALGPAWRIFLSLSGRAKLVFASTLSVKTIRRGGARVVGQGRIALG